MFFEPNSFKHLDPAEQFEQVNNDIFYSYFGFKEIFSFNGQVGSVR